MVPQLVDQKTAPDAESTEEKSAWNLISNVVGKGLRKIVDITLDSVSQIADVVSIDSSQLSKGLIRTDPNAALRAVNEKLLDWCIFSYQKTDQRIAIFVDEIHFSYRNGLDHDQDASLVRDLIRSVAKLNRAFSEARVPCRVFAAIRSEFLSHPLISAAELHQYLNTFGVEISWSTFPATFEHPMFQIGALRVDVGTSGNLSGNTFMRACFANFTQADAAEFVQSTWSKPRDMIRFLRSCKEMFPEKLTLSMGEYKAAFHRSCIHAWKEVEIALTSFLTISGVERVRKLLASKSSVSLEVGNIGSVEKFVKLLQPIAKAESQVGSMKDGDSLFEILYMLGCVYTTRSAKTGQIIHSFHRGQSNPDRSADVAIHRGVAKSFS